jgi:hypothetical protein
LFRRSGCDGARTQTGPVHAIHHASWAELNFITPSVIEGHRNAPCSSRFQNSTRPEPSHATILIPSARFARNTKIVPENGSCLFGLAPRVSTPPKQLPRRQPMPSGNRADRRAGLVALSNDLRLVFCRSAPAPTRTGEHFQAPRRLRFKQKLRVRHVTASNRHQIIARPQKKWKVDESPAYTLPSYLSATQVQRALEGATQQPRRGVGVTPYS